MNPGKCIPNNCADIIPRKRTCIFSLELLGDHDPGNLISSLFAPVRLVLAIWIILHQDWLEIQLTHPYLEMSFYLALVVNSITIDIHVSDKNISSSLFLMLTEGRLPSH